MRTLTLLNPHRSRFRRRRSSFRRVPFRGSRLLRSYGIRSNPSMGDYMSAGIAATKKKKSAKARAFVRRMRAAKAAKRRKSSKRKKTPKTTMAKRKKSRKRSTVARRRTSTRRRSTASRRRVLRGGYKVTTYTSKRRGRKRRKMVRLKTRYGSAALRRNPNIAGLFKSVVSKENLQIAGGVIGASLLNKAVMSNFGDKLPMSSTPIVGTLYQAAIPTVIAMGVRRFAPKVAEGLVLGGLVLAVNSLLKQFAPQFAGFSSYVDAPPYPTLPYPTGGISPTTGSIDSGSRLTASIDTATGYSGIYDSPMPFQSDAWAN